MNTADVIALNAGRTHAGESTANNCLASWRSFLRAIRSLLPRRGTNGSAPVVNLKMLDLMHDAICVRSMSGVIEYWNPAAEDLYGWTATEAVGRVSHALFKTVFPAPLDRIEAELLSRGCWEGELVHALKDGTRVTVASRWSVLGDRMSAPIAILEANTDITEDKRAEAERLKLEGQLRESEEQWKAVFENNPVMYFMVDAAGTILSVNPFGAEQLGYRVEELIGQPVQSVFHEADREVVQRNAAICFEQPGRPLSWELRKARKNGEMIWVRETARATLINNRPVLLIVCEDISEARRTAEALREVQTELAHANRVASLGQLTASIAHEINQPITAALSSGSAALRWLDQGDPEAARRSIERAIRDVTRVADVISGVRTLVRKAAPRTESFDMNEAIREVMVITHGEAAKHGISVESQLAEGLPPIEGVRVRVQQVILNLVMNAIEAMSGVGEGPRELLIKSEKPGPDSVLVAVQDSGPGLDPATADRAFEAFYTTKPEGLGIGLSICRSIVEAHGGTLAVSANVQRGAIFQVRLPMRGDAY